MWRVARAIDNKLAVSPGYEQITQEVLKSDESRAGLTATKTRLQGCTVVQSPTAEALEHAWEVELFQLWRTQDFDGEHRSS